MLQWMVVKEHACQFISYVRDVRHHLQLPTSYVCSCAAPYESNTRICAHNTTAAHPRSITTAIEALHQHMHGYISRRHHAAAAAAAQQPAHRSLFATCTTSKLPRHLLLPWPPCNCWRTAAVLQEPF
jgi:hypothetical protein